MLFFSSVDERVYAVRLIRGGAQGFVSKESSVDELLSAVRTVAAGKRYVGSTTAEALADYVVRPQAGLPHESLSDREFVVLQLLAAGRNVKQISEQLNLGQTTVSTYRTRLLRKMGLSSNAELTIYAVKHDLV